MTGIAVATPGSGATATNLARGLATEKVKTRGNQPYDVVAQEIVIAPGGHTGWHTHPGNAVAIHQVRDAHDLQRRRPVVRAPHLQRR